MSLRAYNTMRYLTVFCHCDNLLESNLPDMHTCILDNIALCWHLCCSNTGVCGNEWWSTVNAEGFVLIIQNSVLVALVTTVVWLKWWFSLSSDSQKCHTFCIPRNAHMHRLIACLNGHCHQCVNADCMWHLSVQYVNLIRIHYYLVHVCILSCENHVSVYAVWIPCRTGGKY